jgi:phosphoglucosamine mutase
MSLRFGTDGVRGVANAELTPSYVLDLGRAAARVLGGRRMLIGRDTRRSGSLIEASLAAGFAAEGVDVDLLGQLPTPAVAALSADEGVPAAVITASHNPFADNGVKLFAAGGRKLPDEVEAGVERAIHELTSPTRTGMDVGVVSHRIDAAEWYERHLLGLLPPRPLAGLRVVLDCANGATSAIAPSTFRDLGAEVTVIHASPDGSNINAGCGATDPTTLAETVVRVGAAAGLAFDGDGDRVIAVDHRGRVVDGDRIIGLIAGDLRAQGRLHDDTVVVTVMTNLGFHRAMRERGINVVATDVGDRYVLEALAAGGFSIGGEQSGHLILSDLATTGDGILAGAVLLDLVGRSGSTLAELADSVMTTFPQVLLNVRVAERHPNIAADIAADIAEAQQALGEHGRVLIRPSGTEPLIRVMVEADTAEVANETATRLAAIIEARFASA